jgi:hypothetical protein
MQADHEIVKVGKKIVIESPKRGRLPHLLRSVFSASKIDPGADNISFDYNCAPKWKDLSIFLLNSPGKNLLRQEKEHSGKTRQN